MRFHAEGWENGEWTGVVSGHDTLAAAEIQLGHKQRRWPDIPMRLMAVLTVHVPVAGPSAREQRADEMLSATGDTLPLISRQMGLEHDRALAAETRLTELLAKVSRLAARLDGYRASRQRWMKSAYADRQSVDVLAAERDRLAAQLTAIREYVATSDDDGTQTRKKIRGIAGEPPEDSPNHNE